MTGPTWYWSAKGGQGTTVTAVAVAVRSARAQVTYLIGHDADPYLVLGMGVPCAPEHDVARFGVNELRLSTVADLNSEAMAGWAQQAEAEGATLIVDGGRTAPPRHWPGDSVLVTRNDYVAMAHYVKGHHRADYAVLVLESGRSLTERDVKGTLAVPVEVIVRHTAAITRTIDAGTFGDRLPATIEDDLNGARPVYQPVQL